MQVFKRQPQGFSLLEILITLGLLSILLALALFSWSGFQERYVLMRAKTQVVQLLKQAQFFSLTLQRSHQMVATGSVLQIDHVPAKGIRLGEEHMPEGIQISANRWPSFSPFGFARSGTILLESKQFQIKVITGTLGRIRHSPLQKK